MKNFKGIGDVVADEMATIMDSDEYKSVFAKPDLSKTAAKKCKCPSDCKCVKGHKKGEECKCDKADKKDKKDKKEKKASSVEDRFNLVVKSISKISEVLDEIGFVKSSVAALSTLEQMVVEAEEMCSEDEGSADDAKERKMPEHKPESPMKNAPPAEPKPKRPSNYKPEWEREKFEIGSADDEDDDSAADDAKERKMPEHKSESPMKNAPPAEPKPKRPSNYKPEWEREKFEIGDADDAKERELPEHKSESPMKNAPPAEPKPKRPSNYKPEWEREKFEIGDAKDGEVHGAYEAAIDVGIKDDSGMADDGASDDYMYDDDEPNGEALRELLDALGLDSSEDDMDEEHVDMDESLEDYEPEDMDEDEELKLVATAADKKKDFIFPKTHSKVTDDKDHFPIDTEGRARNALARANQFSKSPSWYSGSLSSLVSTVANAVKRKYKGIEVSDKSKKPGKG